MSLEYAILGFLQYQPLSGYDLKKAFDTSVRHFWAADTSGEDVALISRIYSRTALNMKSCLACTLKTTAPIEEAAHALG